MPPRPSPPRLYLRKRRDGNDTWIILDGGRQIRTGASEGDRRTAEKALEAYLGKKHRPSFGDGHPAQVALTDVLAIYAEKHAPTTTHPNQIAAIALKLAEYFAGRTVASLTPEACQDYITWRCGQRDARTKKKQAKFISTGTARRELVVLAAALGWCWKNRKLDRPIPMTLPDQPGPREIHLTRSEAARLLAGALGWDGTGKRHHHRINRHLARFILLGLYTGTRHDAMLRLQWIPSTTGGYVDLDDNVIYRLPRQAIETKKKKPPLPIPPRLLPHLRRWRRLTARYLIEWHGLHVAHEHRAWHRARELAGLAEGITPHTLRHTCATWLLQAGVSIYDTAGVLGCSEAIVRRTYGHHATEHLRGAVAVFSRRPSGNGTAMKGG
jgi:integrase